MPAGRIFRNGIREVSDMSRARVTFQGLLVRFAHPVTFNVGAVLGHAMWCISVHNESECVRLISISGSVSKSN